MSTSIVEKARADSFFLFFSLMDSDRSLEKLHSYVTKMGLNISLTSLKRYSAKYNWQERLKEVQAKKVERMDEYVVNDVVEMNIRQAKLGQAMQGIAGIGLQHVKNNPTRLSPRDAVYLGDTGSKLERLARGEATDRHELTVQIVEPLVRQIVALFEQVNVLVDENARARQFAIGADSIIVDNFKDHVN